MTTVYVVSSANDLRHRMPAAADARIFVSGFGLFAWAAASTATDNGSSVIRPKCVSGAGRWVLSNASSVILPSWFGAVGDGIANDQPAVQSALLLAASAGVPLYVPAGTYLLGTYGSVGFLDVLITSSVTIRGDGAASILAIGSNATSAPFIGITDGSVGSLVVENLAFSAPGGSESSYGGPYAIGAQTDATTISLDSLAIRNCTLSRLTGALRFRVAVDSYEITGNTIIVSGTSVSADPERQVIAIGCSGVRASSIAITDNVCSYYDSGTSLPAEHFLYTYGGCAELDVSRNTIPRLRAGAIQLYITEAGGSTAGDFGTITIHGNTAATAQDLGQQWINISQDGNKHHTVDSLTVTENVATGGNASSMFFYTNMRCGSVVIEDNSARSMVPASSYHVIQFELPSGETIKSSSVQIVGNDIGNYGSAGIVSHAVMFADAVTTGTVTGNEMSPAGTANASCKSVVATASMTATVRGNVSPRSTTFAGGTQTIVDNSWQ